MVWLRFICSPSASSLLYKTKKRDSSLPRRREPSSHRWMHAYADITALKQFVGSNLFALPAQLKRVINTRMQTSVVFLDGTLRA